MQKYRQFMCNRVRIFAFVYKIDHESKTFPFIFFSNGPSWTISVPRPFVYPSHVGGIPL